MAVTTTTGVLAWANVASLDSARYTELNRCINAAEDMVEQAAGRLITLTAFTDYYDGDTLNGSHYLVMNPANRPVVYPSPGGHAAFAVTENGTALTVTTGYDSTGTKVVVAVSNNDAAGQLYRPGGWSTGVQNIKVQYSAGWDSTTSPPSVVQLVNETAWLVFNTSTFVGKQNVSHAGAAISWEKDLSPMARATLDSLRQVW